MSNNEAEEAASLVSDTETRVSSGSKRRKLNFLKCTQCRIDKKLCNPSNRTWPEKCQRCKAKSLPCSPPEKVDKHRAGSREPSQLPVAQQSTSTSLRTEPTTSTSTGPVFSSPWSYQPFDSRQLQNPTQALPSAGLGGYYPVTLRPPQLRLDRAHPSSDGFTQNSNYVKEGFSQAAGLKSYTTSSALLLSWEDDIDFDMHLAFLASTLQLHYRFAFVDRWQLPVTPRRYMAFIAKTESFVATHGGENKLLVLYYGGQARPQSGSGPIWASTKHADAVTVEMSAILPILAETQSDVLLFLDSPYAMLEPFDTDSTGVVSAIAASNADQDIAVSQTGLFTRLLNKGLPELYMSRNVPGISDLDLYKCLKVEYLVKPEVTPKPIHRFLTANVTPRPIWISDIDRLRIAFDTFDTPVATENATTGHPSILLDVKLEASGQFDQEELKEWIRRAPAAVTAIRPRSYVGAQTYDEYFSNSGSNSGSIPVTHSSTDTSAASWLTSQPDHAHSIAKSVVTQESSSHSQKPASPADVDVGKDLKCPICGFEPVGRADNRRAYLRKHMRTHQRPSIKCKCCDKAFTRQDNMRMHMRKVHFEDERSGRQTSSETRS
ncbi:hypothetical protein GGR57DRAFT_152775 [Xylariaceae sp. FL1272]|nr:hypothetical protein GGR57DRAFT_152775 [Xylariaceae sp. FL1272]